VSAGGEPALTAVLAERLARVEPLRRAALRTELLRLAAYGAAGLAFLALLPATAVGSMWLLGNFVTQNLAIVVPAMLAAVAGVIALAIVTFKRLTRWRATPDADYRAAFRSMVIAPTLREALPDFVIDSAPAFDAAAFDASALFAPADDRHEVSLALTGTIDGQRLRIWVLRVWRHGYSHDRKQSVDVTIFRGLQVHAPASLAMRGTVRVVSRHEYEGGDRPKWGVVRRGGTVRVTQPVDGLPHEAALVLDEGMTDPPPVAAALAGAWPSLRAAMATAAPAFASVNAGGLYAAWATPASHRAMLEAELSAPNNADELAREAVALQRAVAATAQAAARCFAA
jgi:hypothetical protein